MYHKYVFGCTCIKLTRFYYNFHFLFEVTSVSEFDAVKY